MKSPKAPAPTAEETVMRQRQVGELARLDDEENTRMKRLVRGRLGAGSLLGGRRSSRGPRDTARGSMVTAGSSEGGGAAGGYADWSAP